MIGLAIVIALVAISMNLCFINQALKRIAEALEKK